MRAWRWLLVMVTIGTLVLASAVMLSGQEVDPEMDTPFAVNVSGQWKGLWKNSSGHKGVLTASFNQSLSGISGTLLVQGTPCGDLNVTVEGKVAGTFVDLKGPFTCNGRRQIFRFAGGVHQNNFVGGSWYVTAAGSSEVEELGPFYIAHQ